MIGTAWEWWRERRRNARRSSSRTRVTLPAVVDAPSATLVALRTLDPRLDLYPLPHGVVWLLRKTDHPARIHAGRKLLALFREDNGNVAAEPMYTEHLMAEGFELLSEHVWHEGWSAGAMLARAQRVLYATAAQVEADMRERRAVADSSRHAEERTRVIRERIRSGSRWDHARTYRGGKMFAFSHGRA